jgi:hypothetical protein
VGDEIEPGRVAPARDVQPVVRIARGGRPDLERERQSIGRDALVGPGQEIRGDPTA